MGREIVLMFRIGDRVTWRTANGHKSGVVESFEPEGILVRLDNGKCIVAHEKSLQPQSIIIDGN